MRCTNYEFEEVCIVLFYQLKSHKLWVRRVVSRMLEFCRRSCAYLDTSLPRRTVRLHVFMLRKATTRVYKQLVDIARPPRELAKAGVLAKQPADHLGP